MKVRESEKRRECGRVIEEEREREGGIQAYRSVCDVCRCVVCICIFGTISFGRSENENIVHCCTWY